MNRGVSRAALVASFTVFLTYPAIAGGPPNPTPSDSAGNTAGGSGTLFNNTGSANTAFGLDALTSNSGYLNTATGADALARNTTGARATPL